MPSLLQLSKASLGAAPSARPDAALRNTRNASKENNASISKLIGTVLVKGSIWLMGGILLKERNMADGTTAKLDADAAPK